MPLFDTCRKLQGAAILAALLLGISSTAAAAPPGPPPGGFGGPGMHRPGPPPGGLGHHFGRPDPGHRPPPAYVRPAPPPPPPPPRRHHRDWEVAVPLVASGLIAGAIIADHASTKEAERIVEVPVPPPAPPEYSTSPVTATHPWYWCASEGAYYPAVRTCPLGWETVMGTSATTPPAPPAP